MGATHTVQSEPARCQCAAGSLHWLCHRSQSRSPAPITPLTAASVWVNVTVPQALNHVAIGASDVDAICRHAHSQLSCIPSWAARAAALSSWWGRYRAQQPGLALRINHASTGQVQHQRPPYTPSC